MSRRPDSQSASEGTSSAITDDRAVPLVLTLFIAVGGTATVAYILICTFFTDILGLRAVVASLMGYGIAVPPAYWAQKAITFRSRAFHRVAFPKYLTVQLVGSVVAAVLGEILVGRIGFPSLICFSIVALVVGLANFFTLKYWTFAVQ
jgi:putative flippase GtrA